MRRALMMADALGVVFSTPSAMAQTTWIDGSPIQTRLRVGADGRTYVGVWIDAPSRVVATARAPMDIALVVDTSGSMAGDKIHNAQIAAASLLESTIRFRSAWLTIIPYALVLLAVPVGAILGARTRRSLPPGDRCAQCGYDITNCTGNECPECGVSFFVKPPLPKND